MLWLPLLSLSMLLLRLNEAQLVVFVRSLAEQLVGSYPTKSDSWDAREGTQQPR